MTWYELLMSLHVMAAALWFGSGLAITVIAYRTLAVGREAFASFTVPAAWWAGRAHPAAGVVMLLTGFGMVADAGYSLGETWLVLAIVGLVAALAIGGALIGRTSDAMTKQIEGAGGVMAPELVPTAQRLLLYTRIESAILALVIVDMIAKPGA